MPIDALDYNIDYVGRFLIDGYRFEDILERTINPFRNRYALASLSRDEIDNLWCISKELNEIFLIKVGSAGSNDLFCSSAMVAGIANTMWISC